MDDWRIFYDDGSEITGSGNDFGDIPSFGIICIVQEKHDGRKHIISQKDYYAFTGTLWIVLDMMGVIDHLVHKPESIEKLLVGRTIDDKSYWDIFERAKKYI